VITDKALFSSSFHIPVIKVLSIHYSWGCSNFNTI